MPDTGHHRLVTVELWDNFVLTFCGHFHTDFYLRPYVARPKKGVLMRSRMWRERVSPFQRL